MYFNSVEQILTQLEKQPGWEKFRDYRQLLKCWHNTVNQNTAKHTRPLHITRQVLWVATSSAARAQELSFQRYTLLKRLNKQLPFTLKDIRFSSSQWHQKTYLDTNEILFSTSKPKSKKTTSNIGKQINSSRNTNSVTEAKIAAKRWLETISKSSSLSCPNCGAFTPTGEIERWNCCYLCVAQKWSKEYRPPTFPE